MLVTRLVTGAKLWAVSISSRVAILSILVDRPVILRLLCRSAIRPNHSVSGLVRPTPHRAYKKGSGKKSGIPVDKIRVPTFLPDNEIIRSDIADYYFEVQRWDSDVGAAMKLLEKAGELDNTIIIMTGDHGFPFPRAKGNLYDWGSRVPLALRWGDKVQANRSVTDFVSG